MEEKNNNKKYWIFGGIAGAIILTNVVNYLLTSYFVGKNYKIRLETKNKIVAEQKTTIDSLIDSLESVTKRKRDYQKGIEILSKYIDKEINVEEKIINAYERKEIKDGEAFRFILSKIPNYPKSKK